MSKIKDRSLWIEVGDLISCQQEAPEIYKVLQIERTNFSISGIHVYKYTAPQKGTIEVLSKLFIPDSDPRVWYRITNDPNKYLIYE